MKTILFMGLLVFATMFIIGKFKSTGPSVASIDQPEAQPAIVDTGDPDPITEIETAVAAEEAEPEQTTTQEAATQTSSAIERVLMGQIDVPEAASIDTSRSEKPSVTVVDGCAIDRVLNRHLYGEEPAR